MRGVSVIEPASVGDDFVVDTYKIETVGPCARFFMVTSTHAIDGSTEYVVVRKLVIPHTSLRHMIDKAEEYLATMEVGRAIHDAPLCLAH